MSYGGQQQAMERVFCAMLCTGQFDNVVENYCQQSNIREGSSDQQRNVREVSSDSDSLPFQFISSGEKIASVHLAEQQRRERVGKVMSREDVANKLGDNYFSGSLGESEFL